MPEIQTFAAGDAPLTDAGAEVTDGETNTEKPADTDPRADEEKIEDYNGSERYRTTELEPGSTSAISPQGDKSYEKEGIKFDVLEPSNNTTDKRSYGFEIEIDKETGQRTYTLIDVSSTAFRNAPVNLGDKPMMEVGEKLYDDAPEVNYKAEGDSAIVTGSRFNYGYRASVADLEHINNVKNDRTVFGMKDTYTKDNATGTHMLGNDVSFNFKVNPWPDENDSLMPIKLNGDYVKKEFVKGQVIDTGLTVQNLDDNAKLRLTGKVYHPTTGKIVPGAEAFIDVNGNVFVRLPAGAVDADGNINEDSIFYKDKEYRGIQSLDVKFYARPRTQGEFQAVAAAGAYQGTYVETGAGTAEIVHNGNAVDISKQGIDRYDHYNDIGGFTINLDDTKDHDQAFVDQDGTLTEDETASYVKPGVPYKVTNNDEKSIEDITDAVNKERANARLDLSLIDKKNEGKAPDDQWKVEGTDNALTDIKITAPKNAKSGDFVSFSVRYTYTNGSIDNHKLTFIVKDSGNNIPQYYSQVLYPTETETSLPHLSITAEDQEKRRPVEYTIEDKTYTDDHGNAWTASIDSKTGIVTVKPLFAKDFIGGEKLVVPVTAHYVEEENNELTFTEEVRAAFVVKQKLNSLPIYDAKNGKAGESLTSTPTVKGDAGLETRTPTSYSIANTEYTDNKGNVWTVSINKETGEVTAKIPDIREGNKLDGTIISVPVTAHYEENGQETGTREATAQFLASGTNNTIEHKEEIPFDTIVEVNNDLAKGEWRYKTVDGIEQKGQLGEIKTTWTIENSKVVDTTKDRTEPVAAIIEIGQKDYSGTLEYVDKDPVPFETEVTIDPSLEPNQIVEDKAGVLGEQETKVTREITNGVAGEEVRGETKQTIAPVNRKIRIGAKSNGTQTIEEKVEVPFETIVEFDDSLAPGEQKVSQEGVPGKKTRTTTLTIVNGEVTETKSDEFKQTQAPTNKIIKVGRNTDGLVKHEEAIPFDYKVEYDSTIPAGEYKIEVPGKAGTRTTEWNIKNSEVVGQPTVTVVDPVQAVIKVGNKDFTGEVRHTEDFAIPYTVEINYNPELPVGTTNVIQQGKAGSYKVTYTQNIKNGETTGELVKTQSDRVEAKNQIIEIGTKAVEPNTTTVTSPVQPAIDLEYNPDLAKGVVQKGEITPGEVKTVVVTTRDPETGQLVTKEETIQTSPRQKIIIGTKDFTGEYKYTEEKVDEYKTTVVFDDTLAPGEEVIDKQGINGVSRREVTVNITNGQAANP